METIINNVQDYTDAFLVELAFTALMTYGGFLTRWFFRTRESRDALHSALGTGVNMITDQIFDLARKDAHKQSDGQMVDSIVAYTKQSVPDAIKWLKPNDNVLRKMAKGYLNAAKARLLN